ncbi:extracellular solute-binding protein [Protofrankia symbiont of Coriaria ruscifolia]|uniref:extracellular solute-binding protein n=1 Tax=Protofrankia symbiont of Coriaria ruscifolia TaxID=1306542 RepID=UPI0010414EC7|nr:extracellular solute-binding protein [Protofrankia symbiont of Coriaria ruscifolia]
MSRTRYLLAPLAAAVLLATACGNGSGAAPVATAANVADCDPRGVTITTTFAQQGKEAAAAAKKALEAEHPGLTVQLNESSGLGYDQLTQQVVADLAAGKETDVVMVGLGQVRFWVDRYQPQPINTAALKPTYDRRFLKIGEVDGKPYVVPFQVSAPVLFTNTDLATKAGITKAPATSSELLADARKVKQATGTAPVALPRDAIADWVVQAYIQSAGATFVNPDGTAGFDTDTGRRALSLYSELGAQQLAAPISAQDATAQFAKGDLAYLVTSPAFAASMRTQVGDRFGWTVTDFPIPDGGHASLPAGGNGWLVLSHDACKAAFANEMISAMLDPTVIAASLRTFSYIPVDKQAAAELTAAPEATTQLGYSWTYTGTPTPWGGWHGDATPKVNKILGDMVVQLTNGQPVDQVLPTVIRQINAVVK